MSTVMLSAAVADVSAMSMSTVLARAPRPARAAASAPAMALPDGSEPAYENPLLSLVGRLLPSGDERASADSEQALPAALAGINWNAPKRPERNLARNARRLEQALAQEEWFVTGQVRPAYFSDDPPFVFKDPDVTLMGVRAYALGVHRLFDQATSRAEIARVAVRQPSTIELAWRLSGGVTLGPFALSLKPYVVYTDLVVDERGLIVYQEDRFSIPPWDILLSALLPALRPLLSAAAPPIEELRAQLASEGRAG